MKKIIGKVAKSDIIGYLIEDDKKHLYIVEPAKLSELIHAGEIDNAIIESDGSLLVNGNTYVRDLNCYSIHKERIVDPLVFELTAFIKVKLKNGEILKGYRFNVLQVNSYSSTLIKSVDIDVKYISPFLKLYKTSNMDVKIYNGRVVSKPNKYEDIETIYADIKDLEKATSKLDDSKEVVEPADIETKENKVVEPVVEDVKPVVEKTETIVNKKDIENTKEKISVDTKNRCDTPYIIKKGQIMLNNEKRDLLVIEGLGGNVVNSNKIHYIHIVDTSGSMQNDIDNLKKNVKESIVGMEPSDIVSVIKLNASGNSKILFSGVPVKDIWTRINEIDRMIAYGKTCFSEPLKLVNHITKIYNDTDVIFCVSLFTDGVPVVSWEEKEEKDRCYKEAEEIAKKVLALNTIGYTNNYDDVFLKKLSSYTVLGKYTHAKDIDDYGKLFKHSYYGLKEAELFDLRVEAKGMIVYNSSLGNYSGNNLLNMPITGSNGTLVVILDKNEDTVYINGRHYTVNDNLEPLGKDEYDKAIYTLANTSLYDNKRDLAVETLKNINDNHLVSAISTAFTKEEKQNVLNELQDAIDNKNHRFIGSSNKAVRLGEEYCLVDLFSELKDSNSYIDSETFKGYSRIGIKRNDIKPMFNITKSDPVPFNMVKFNSKRANMSVGFVYEGYVELEPEEANNTGLQYIFPDYKVKCKTIRNYSIVKDGELNTGNIIMHITDSQYQSLRLKPTLNGKLITSCETSNIVNGTHRYKKVTLNIKAIPILNNKYVGDNEFKKVYDDYVLLCKSKARRKVLNYYITKLEGPQTNNFEVFSLEQIEVLEKHGINNKLEYVGVGTKKEEENTDYYIAREYEFKLAKASVMPSVEDAIAVKDKRMDKTGLYMDSMVDYVRYLDEFESKPYSDKLRIYKFHLEKVNKFIGTLESKLNIQRMARILTNTVWSGLTKISDSHYEYLGDAGRLKLEIKDSEIPYTNK